MSHHNLMFGKSEAIESFAFSSRIRYLQKYSERKLSTLVYSNDRSPNFSYRCVRSGHIVLHGEKSGCRLTL